MRLIRIRKFAVIIAVLAGALGGVVAAAPAASAQVLVNQPASSVCLGRALTVGVWYQEFSGGSRLYRVAVYNPRGTRVLYRSGKAPSAHWQFWRVRVHHIGKYRIVYHVRFKGRWLPYQVTARSHRC